MCPQSSLMAEEMDHGLAGGGGHPLGVTEKQLELRRAFYCPSELLAWALCGLSLRSADGWSSDLFSFP